MSQSSSRFNKVTRVISLVVVLTFSMNMVLPPQVFAAPGGTILGLPVPGTMVGLTKGYVPALIKGLKLHPDNPLAFDFVIDTGHSKLEGDALKEESRKLIKYFLASLTVPAQELWVNLSPEEKDRIIPNGFGQTEMGRDLLAQDYLLKQLTASLMYPEDELGKKFWDRVFAKAKKLTGSAEIPVNTFNKVWIVPDEAEVYEYEGTAYVVARHLKVMLEEDYKTLDASKAEGAFGLDKVAADDIKASSKVASDVVREVLIPELEREVNEGKTFASLRQIFDAMILATWYKQNLRESLLGKVYVDQNKVRGVDVEDKQIKEKIYQQYLEAFQKGVYNYIKEDVDADTGRHIPRKYFSGGVAAGNQVDRLVSGSSSVGSKPERDLSPRKKRFLARTPGSKTVVVSSALGENPTERATKASDIELARGIPASSALAEVRMRLEDRVVVDGKSLGQKEVVAVLADAAKTVSQTVPGQKIIIPYIAGDTKNLVMSAAERAIPGMRFDNHLKQWQVPANRRDPFLNWLQQQEGVVNGQQPSDADFALFEIQKQTRVYIQDESLDPADVETVLVDVMDVIARTRNGDGVVVPYIAGDTKYLVMTAAKETIPGMRFDSHYRNWRVPAENRERFEQWVGLQLDLVRDGVASSALETPQFTAEQKIKIREQAEQIFARYATELQKEMAAYPISEEQRQLLVDINIKYGQAMFEKWLSAEGEPLKMAERVPEGTLLTEEGRRTAYEALGGKDVFIAGALLSPDERAALMHLVNGGMVVQDEANAAVAQELRHLNVSMIAGTGGSFKRIKDYLEKLLGRTTISAKAVDTILQGEVEIVHRDGTTEVSLERANVNELKIIRQIERARSRLLRELALLEMVNADSEPHVNQFWRDARFSPFLEDRLDKDKPEAERRSYEEVFESTPGLQRIKDFIVQAKIPIVRTENGEILTHPDALTPGGHGFLATFFLWYLTTQDNLPFDTAEQFNSEALNDMSPEAVLGYIVRNNIGIGINATTRTGTDAKGGVLGIILKKVGERIIAVPYLFEKAEAEISGQFVTEQGDPGFFQMVGLPGGVGEAFAQPFNLNVPAENLRVLIPLLKKYRAIVGDEEFLGSITPSLIMNPRMKKIDGVETSVFQLEGALVAALLNLNFKLLSSDDARVQQLLREFGLENGIVSIINFGPELRNNVFTPIKYAYDLAVFLTDMYRVDFKKGKIEVTDTTLNMANLPQFVLSKQYEDVGQTLRRWGNPFKGETMVSFKDAVRDGGLTLKVQEKGAGAVTYAGAKIQAGRVEIIASNDADIDLNQVAALPKDAEGRLILDNVRIVVHKDGLVKVESLTKKNPASSAVAAERLSAIDFILERMTPEASVIGIQQRAGGNIKWIRENMLLLFGFRQIGKLTVQKEVRQVVQEIADHFGLEVVDGYYTAPIRLEFMNSEAVHYLGVRYPGKLNRSNTKAKLEALAGPIQKWLEQERAVIASSAVLSPEAEKTIRDIVGSITGRPVLSRRPADSEGEIIKRRYGFTLRSVYGITVAKNMETGTVRVAVYRGLSDGQGQPLADVTLESLAGFDQERDPGVQAILAEVLKEHERSAAAASSPARSRIEQKILEAVQGDGVKVPETLLTKENKVVELRQMPDGNHVVVLERMRGLFDNTFTFYFVSPGEVNEVSGKTMEIAQPVGKEFSGIAPEGEAVLKRFSPSEVLISAEEGGHPDLRQLLDVYNMAVTVKGASSAVRPEDIHISGVSQDFPGDRGYEKKVSRPEQLSKVADEIRIVAAADGLEVIKDSYTSLTALKKYYSFATKEAEDLFRQYGIKGVRFRVTGSLESRLVNLELFVVGKENKMNIAFEYTNSEEVYFPDILYGQPAEFLRSIADAVSRHAESGASSAAQEGSIIKEGNKIIIGDREFEPPAVERFLKEARNKLEANNYGQHGKGIQIRVDERIGSLGDVVMAAARKDVAGLNYHYSGVWRGPEDSRSQMEAWLARALEIVTSEQDSAAKMTEEEIDSISPREHDETTGAEKIMIALKGDVAKRTIEIIISEKGVSAVFQSRNQEGILRFQETRDLNMDGRRRPDGDFITAGLAAFNMKAANSAVDRGQASVDQEEVGGINLNPELLDLQIKRDGRGIPLPLEQQPLETMTIDGFVPVIINIMPIAGVPMLLGLADTNSDNSETSRQSNSPADEQLFWFKEEEQLSMAN